MAPPPDPGRPLHLRPLDRRLAGPRPVRRRHPARRSTRSSPCTSWPSAAPAASPSTTTTWSRSAPTTPSATSTSPAFKDACAETGMTVPMMTTNLFTHPVFKDGGFTSNDRSVRRFALRKVAAQRRPGRRARRPDLRLLGRPRGRGVRRRQGRARRARPLPRGRRHARRLRPGAGLRHPVRASSRSPTSPAATSCCRPSATRWRSSPSSSTRDMVGLNPEVGHEQMAGLNFAARHRAGAVGRQAVPHRPQRPALDQVRPGPGLRPRRPALRVLPRRPARERLADGGPTYDGPRHFDYKPSRTEDIDGVWASAGRTWRPTCCSRSGPRPSAPTPRCRPPSRRPAWPSCAQPTLAEGETVADLLADRSAFEDFDADEAAEHGFGFVRLNQLALEHLLGAR